ncbi:unnamed protein product [marine sediment metagenome]|uniref:Uncharacterized protein n=1 Tax=marine sediment metagenome TaxID=412755 RepID=X1IRH8_9ZZZZ
MPVEIRKGKLIQFHGSWGSGLGTLEIEDSKTGAPEHVHCDNGATVRALEAAFGDVITEGHTANGDGYKGQEVYWSYDEFGLVLEAFTPVEDASPELVNCYQENN